jgi:hypothetical protein
MKATRQVFPEVRPHGSLIALFSRLCQNLTARHLLFEQRLK